MMEEEKRLKQYKEGYDAGKRDLIDEKCVEQYAEGYKSGYKDGYQAAMEMMIGQLPPEIKQKMIEEGAQPFPRIW
jgi:flagellar biosynthesis/type III secretory pathway protein FliH